jgi:hypothetical protein
MKQNFRHLNFLYQLFYNFVILHIHTMYTHIYTFRVLLLELIYNYKSHYEVKTQKLFCKNSGVFDQTMLVFFRGTVLIIMFWYKIITFTFVHYYNKFLWPTSILECNSHKIKIHVYILNFVISGLTIWMSIPYLLCLIIDKCRRQKLCKRAQKISTAAPLRVMASRYNPCE